MNLKSRKPLQVGAVSLALTMLTSYVVYSQRQGSQNVAPGSKSAAIDVVLDKTAIQEQAAGTNKPLHRSLTVVAPSSKSIAPVVAIPATSSSKISKVRITNAPSQMVISSSKSAMVFHPKDVTNLMPNTAPVPVLGLTPEQADQRFSSDSHMVMYSSKSGVVFRPQDVSVLMPQPAHGWNSPAPLPHPNETTRYSTLFGATNYNVSLKPLPAYP
jgi:hypothetical protein